MLTCPRDPMLTCTPDTACPVPIGGRCWFLNDITMIETLAAAKAAREAAAKEGLTP